MFSSEKNQEKKENCQINKNSFFLLPVGRPTRSTLSFCEPNNWVCKIGRVSAFPAQGDQIRLWKQNRPKCGPSLNCQNWRIASTGGENKNSPKCFGWFCNFSTNLPGAKTTDQWSKIRPIWSPCSRIQCWLFFCSHSHAFFSSTLFCVFCVFLRFLRIFAYFLALKKNRIRKWRSQSRLSITGA
jgi:hypothetical protein